MNIQETKDTLERFRAWVIRLNRDLKDPALVRKYMDEDGNGSSGLKSTND